jgi:DNA (cytosine-5)-methyltransferase 1
VTPLSVFDHESGTLSPLDREVVRHVPPGGNWRNLPHDFPSARVRQIRESAARGEGSRSTYYGRLAWDHPSYTISTYFTRPGNGSFIHPELSRVLTVREAARLQGFPDSVRFHGSLRQKCMQVGNAVPPLLAYQIGRTIPAGTVVDLFAGAGGVGLGLNWAGHSVVASVDNNPDACRTLVGSNGPQHLVLQRDLGDREQLDDVVARVHQRLDGERLGLLAGGPPCQGFSTAGLCRVDDPRNRLVLSFLRAVERLEPSQVLFENVLALRWRGKAFLDELTVRLDHLGYDVNLRVLHAEAYGVPQLRRRLVIRANAKGAGLSWPLPSYAMIKPCFPADQPGVHLASPVPRTVHDAIADLAVPAASRPGAAVVPLPPESAYARWATGQLPIEALTPQSESAAAEPAAQSSVSSGDTTTHVYDRAVVSSA